MENTMSGAVAALHFLTADIRDVRSKPHLKETLESSLVKAGECDAATASKAVDQFYTGLRAV